jgi:8-oxo-dGTP pyrophosphatase MutT (NUDIX family)
MGAGILPTTIHNNKLYFLFGKENKYESSAPGYSDFGGGTDNNESLFETAVREAGEELTGFLGSSQDVRKLLKKHGTYNIDYSSNVGHSLYRMHIFPLKYDPMLAIYYNNNQQFIQTHLDPNVIKKSKIFEKAEIRWVCVDDILKMRLQFRSYFQNIVDIIHDEKTDINNFIRTSLREKNNKTLKRRYKK